MQALHLPTGEEVLKNPSMIHDLMMAANKLLDQAPHSQKTAESQRVIAKSLMARLRKDQDGAIRKIASLMTNDGEPKDIVSFGDGYLESR